MTDGARKPPSTWALWLAAFLALPAFPAWIGLARGGEALPALVLIALVGVLIPATIALGGACGRVSAPLSVARAIIAVPVLVFCLVAIPYALFVILLGWGHFTADVQPWLLALAASAAGVVAELIVIVSCVRVWLFARWAADNVPEGQVPLAPPPRTLQGTGLAVFIGILTIGSYAIPLADASSAAQEVDRLLAGESYDATYLDSPEGSAALLRALGEAHASGSKPSLKLLRALCDADLTHPGVAKELRQGLQRDDLSADDRMNLCWSLGAIDDRSGETVALVASLLGTGDYEADVSYFTVLSSLQASQCIPEIVDRITAIADDASLGASELEFLVGNGCASLAALDTEASWEGIRTLAAHPRPEVRIAVFYDLRPDDSQAEALLKASLEDPDPSVRNAARLTLQGFGIIPE